MGRAFEYRKARKLKRWGHMARVFTKIGKEITIAVKEGGGDPASNSKLRDLIQKAKANNVPNDNIERCIKKALGSTGETYEEVSYEGYGPAGIAVLVTATTDNRNRTAGNVRHHFDKYGGNLGANGCVSWSFDKKGVLVIDNEDGDYEEDQVMMDAMDCGADDFEADGDVFTVYTTPDDFNAVADALAAKKYSFVSAQIEMVPQNYVKLSAEDAEKMEKMLELFDDDDDVQNTWHNWDQD